MRVFRKLLRLRAADQRLLIEATIFLYVVRLGLWLLPFERLRRLLFRKTARGNRWQGVAQQSVKNITRSVKIMSRYAPAATCLTRALVTLVLFEKYGHLGSLRIAVAKDSAGKLEAHAWVESQGHIVIGSRTDLSRFTVLRAVEEL